MIFLGFLEGRLFFFSSLFFSSVANIFYFYFFFEFLFLAEKRARRWDFARIESRLQEEGKREREKERK